MTDLMRQMIDRKRAWRKEMARLPVGEKLRIVEEMNEEMRAIAATRPPKPTNPVHVVRAAK